MSCEGCSLRFTILKRKKKCEDCGYVFCSECATSKGKLYQCYRCKVLTCVPLNGCDVANLKLRDLQWFLDKKGIDVPSNDRREKPVLVDWVMNYSRQTSAQQTLSPNYQPIYPSLHPEERRIGGLFGTEAASAATVPLAEGVQDHNERTNNEVKENKPRIYNGGNKHQIIDLNSVDSRNQIFSLSAMELKLLLTRNFISFRGCCEKSELQEKVCWLWDLKEAAKNKNVIPDENLCKICMEANIDSLFLDCGHMVTCHQCGKLLHDCPICRQIILRVVRAFKS
ncbi:e3 ubiquitin-protein ligase RNF34 [Trichonephila clavata]|uniref:E3 ubiquitin-protein ligase RNF34 n=1 Tax=Trichonephila clavata TaxID=2740835 RepID=A0A8X6JJ62_TRICU|nr:e3 ubiquitin-protein ligase RNF34 [Trichonephila clavata]